MDQKGHIVGYDAALAKLIARGIVGSEKKLSLYLLQPPTE